MVRDLFRYAHETPGVVWMSQNTNTIPTSPAIRELVVDALDRGEHHLYPQAQGIPGLPEAIRADLALDDSWAVHISTGAIEGLDMINRALVRPGGRVLATDPSFLPIHNQASRLGGQVVEIPIYQPPWRLTPETLADRITPGLAYVLLIDPINPLGTAYPRDMVRTIAHACRDAGVPLVHDVTYRDFDPDHTSATEFYPEGTLVAFSFSKWAGLAGMRIGGVAAPPDLMKRIKELDPNPLGVNALSQVAALGALRTKHDWLPGVLRVVAENQRRIGESVRKVPGCFIPVHPSRANMLLVDTDGTGVHPDRLQEELLFRHNVFVRSGTYVSQRFGTRFIRASFTLPTHECQRFCDAFPVAMETLVHGAP